MNVVLAKIVARSYIYAQEFSIMNMPYEIFLTIQLMHLTCRKYRIHNHLKARKNETCYEEQVTTIQDEE